MKARYLLGILTVAVALICPGRVKGAETATQIANRSQQLLQRAGGISADFTIESDGRKVKGNLKSYGSKFAITTPGMSTWFDGTVMWTYNSRTGETTLTKPTAAEIAETNPMSLVMANNGKFTAYFAKKQPAKGRRIVLVPKTRELGLKTVAVTIDDGTYMPSNIVVTPESGKPNTIHVTGLNTKANFSASDFVYPKDKYPNVEIVDLR